MLMMILPCSEPDPLRFFCRGARIRRRQLLLLLLFRRWRRAARRAAVLLALGLVLLLAPSGRCASSALDLGLAAVRLLLLRLVGGRCRLALALRVHLVVPVPFEPFGSLLRRSPVLAGRALAFVHLPGDAVQIAVGMLVLGCSRLAKLPPAPLAVACRRPSWSFPFGGVATGDAR